VLFQSSESLAGSDVIGDVIPYSTALHILHTRAYPDIRPPYQVYLALSMSLSVCVPVCLPVRLSVCVMLVFVFN